ncbi:class I SAM-dependent methyltransferase [Dongia sp.]|uniref:class I SAM-dependent methyltransferase n=1 Tax=Dongia sp. TaxID=1977262 RepID=UPI0035B234D9
MDQNFYNNLSQIVAAATRSSLVWTLRDVEVASYFRATLDTSEYVEKTMISAKIFRGDKDPRNRGRFELLEFGLQNIALDEGVVLEFGVFKGDTLLYIADRIDTYAYGFDSFEGLPEDWFLDHNKAEFNLKGEIPVIKNHRDNIRLIKGWFDQTLPEFANKLDRPVKFLHIDCDLYSSTKTIFDCLNPHIVKDTVIVFDEYFNYPSWREHEFKAFQEFVAENDVTYEYIGYAPRHYSVAVKILDRK